MLGRNCEKGYPYPDWWECILVQPSGERMEKFPIKIGHHANLAIIVYYISRNENINSNRYVRPNVYGASFMTNETAKYFKQLHVYQQTNK